MARPATSKPKDPDQYDFKDEQLAKDYRKMWEKYNQVVKKRCYEAFLRWNSRFRQNSREHNFYLIGTERVHFGVCQGTLTLVSISFHGDTTFGLQ